jgi:hypothetical protein
LRSADVRYRFTDRVVDWWKNGDSALMTHRDTICKDDFARVTLSVIRYIAAAYATSDAVCWEAAFQFVDDAIDQEDGPFLIARVATLVRAVRRSLNRKLDCLPASCNRLTFEERRLLLLIEAARRKDETELAMAATTLGANEHRAAALRAAKMIGNLSQWPVTAHLRDEGLPNKLTSLDGWARPSSTASTLR